MCCIPTLHGCSACIVVCGRIQDILDQLYVAEVFVAGSGLLKAVIVGGGQVVPEVLNSVELWSVADVVDQFNVQSPCSRCNFLGPVDGSIIKENCKQLILTFSLSELSEYSDDLCSFDPFVVFVFLPVVAEDMTLLS